MSNELIEDNSENTPDQNKFIALKADEIRRMAREQLDNFAISLYFECLKLNAKLRALRKTMRDLELFKQRTERAVEEQDEARKKYFAAQTWALKIVEILKENKEAMTRGQILAKILEYEPDIVKKWVQPENRLSKILSDLVSSEIIERTREKGTTGYYYSELRCP